MVTITADAIAKVEQLIASAGTAQMDWFVIISWEKGAADNRREADGAVSWNIARGERWVAEVAGNHIGKVPREEGTPLFGEVRLLIQDRVAPGPFQGGEIHVEGGALRVREHAI